MAWTTPSTKLPGDLVTPADWNNYVANLNFLYGDTAWTTATLLNGWVGNQTDGNVQFRKIGTRVSLRGQAHQVPAPASGTVIFNLPVGYRPPGSLWRTALQSGQQAFCRIETGGNVWFGGDATTDAFLNQVYFDTLA